MPYKNKQQQKEFQREWSQKNNLKIRLEAIKILGGKCCQCGFTNFRALQIDHIIPDQKGRLVHKGQQNAKDVVSGILTKESVQLLCANCHWIKTYDIDRHNFYLKQRLVPQQVEGADLKSA